MQVAVVITRTLKHAVSFISNSKHIISTIKLHPGVLLPSWSQPWIFLGRLQAHDWASFLPETVFSLQHRRRGSCHMPVVTWRLCISCRRSMNMECVTAHYHLEVIPLVIPATSENFFVPVTTASITLITVSWSWSACNQHHIIAVELNLNQCTIQHSVFTGGMPFLAPTSSVKALNAVLQMGITHSK